MRIPGVRQPVAAGILPVGVQPHVSQLEIGPGQMDGVVMCDLMREFVPVLLADTSEHSCELTLSSHV